MLAIAVLLPLLSLEKCIIGASKFYLTRILSSSPTINYQAIKLDPNQTTNPKLTVSDPTLEES